MILPPLPGHAFTAYDTEKMMRYEASRIGPLLLAAALAGCAAEPSRPLSAPLTVDPVTGSLIARPKAPRIDMARVRAAIDSAAAQVKRCYRHPGVPSSGRSISTRLRVRLSPDGGLTDLPVVVTQTGVTPDNRIFADRMAEAASQAVMRCAPLHLPADLYAGGWDEIDLTFSPAMLV
jgi:hypothetical protein